GEETGAWFRDYHADRGVNFYCARSVVEIDRQQPGTRLALSDGTRLAADVVVAGVGVTPAVDWLSGSGVSAADGVLCDGTVRTPCTCSVLTNVPWSPSSRATDCSAARCASMHHVTSRAGGPRSRSGVRGPTRSRARASGRSRSQLHESASRPPWPRNLPGC